MASLRELGFYSHHQPHHQQNKITKAPRGGKMVKPILKKLASSPKNSLDLDRGWEEQPVDFGGYGGNSAYESGRTSMSRSVRDVSFHPSTWKVTGYSSSNGGGGGGAGAGAGGGGGSTTGSGTATPVHGVVGGDLGLGLDSTSCSPAIGATGVTGARNVGRSSAGGRFTHARSTSGTSHVSIATNGSSHRPGASFVHPFQQTPRTNTPPLAYANSFTSFERDTLPARDYSPTIITENDDDDDFNHLNPASSPLLSQSQARSPSLQVGSHAPSHVSASTSNSNSNSNSNSHSHSHSHSHSTASLRRPSLTSQRTSSLSDIRGNPNPVPSLRVNTTTSTFASGQPQPPRSVPSASSRPVHGPRSNSSYSHSDLALNISPTDSPRPSLQLASPSTSTTAAMSPLRNSLEGAFRLRSRSEVESGVSRVDIREARRKFEENERIKQEKYEAEQRRKQERRQEREKSMLRKNTGGSDMSVLGRPSFSRKRTPPLANARRTRSGESAGGGGGAAMSEKMPNRPGAAAFLSSNYESTEDGTAPDFGLDVNDVRFETPQRAHTAKRKTQSYWTSFVLWFRTRLLRLGRH